MFLMGSLDVPDGVLDVPVGVLGVPELPKPPSDPNPKCVTFVTHRQTDTQTHIYKHYLMLPEK